MGYLFCAIKVIIEAIIKDSQGSQCAKMKD